MSEWESIIDWKNYFPHTGFLLIQCSNRFFGQLQTDFIILFCNWNTNTQIQDYLNMYLHNCSV